MTSATHAERAAALGRVALAGRNTPETNALKPRARHIKDACSILQISRSHLYALASKGEIRLVRIGNRTVVPESEIDRLLGEAA